MYNLWYEIIFINSSCLIFPLIVYFGKTVDNPSIATSIYYPRNRKPFCVIVAKLSPITSCHVSFTQPLHTHPMFGGG